MDFIQAFQAMKKQDSIVRRKSWISMGGDFAIMMTNYTIVQVVEGVSIGTPWVPDQEDLMAKDWETCHSEKIEARKIKKTLIRHCERIESVIKELHSVRFETRSMFHFSLSVFGFERGKEIEINQSLDKALAILEERLQLVRKKIEASH